MPTLLQIDSAIADDASRTRRQTEAFAEAWRARGDAFTVRRRDLHVDPLPHLGQRAQHWPEALREDSPLAEETAVLQQTLIDELLAADALLIGVPMYNYAMPSTLKAWIDLIHVPGVTVPFGDRSQPMSGRPVILATAQGGPLEPIVEDFVIGPLRHLFGTGLGMEVHVVSTSRTLADMLPELGVEGAAEEFASSLERARELGASL